VVAQVASLLFGVGQIKKVSLKPRFEYCYWRPFEYGSRKWVPDGRSWVTETTYGEVSFGERLTAEEFPTTVNSVSVGRDRLALQCAELWRRPSPSCRWFSDQPAAITQLKIHIQPLKRWHLTFFILSAAGTKTSQRQPLKISGAQQTMPVFQRQS